MLDLVLKLIGRLIDLAKKRGEINRATFKDFVEPAFETFELVHRDYIDSLERYYSRLANPKLKMNSNHPVFRDMKIDSLKSGHLRTKLKNFRPTKSPEKLREFLTAIDFYLKGLSSTGSRAVFLDKLVFSQLVSVREIEKGLGGQNGLGNQTREEAILVATSATLGTPVVMFADPMRVALRETLIGIDRARHLSDAQEWETIRGRLEFGSAQGQPHRSANDVRRRWCAITIERTIRHFQDSYSYVSFTYSALRSELLKPT
jgi:hypothetical protein